MSLLWNGILLGIALSILVGPLLLSLIQASIEHGLKAGFAVGFGIWLSDLLFILFTYYGISSAIALTEWDGFKPTLGILGGIILILIGVGTFISRPPKINEAASLGTNSILALAVKGFLINTINPFTIVFWIGVMSTVVVKDALNFNQAMIFLGGIMGTIVFTDTVKVVLSNRIKNWMNPYRIMLMRKIAGAALFIFGIVLMIRVLI